MNRFNWIIAARFTPEFSLNIQDYMLENNPACKDKNDTNI